MTAAPDPTLIALARLEGKVDTLSATVDSGDRQAGQLVELVKQQVGYLQRAVDDLKTLLSDERRHTDNATSVVRVDLERQIREHLATAATIQDGIERQIRDHLDAEVPHPASTLTRRLALIEDSLSRYRGALAVLAVALPVGTSIATAVIIKWLGA